MDSKETENIFEKQWEGVLDLDELSPEGKEKLLEITRDKMIEKMPASEKYEAISKALKDEKTPESHKLVLEAALKELKPLIYREQKIGTIGDRYPDSLVAIRVLGVIAILIGVYMVVNSLLQGGNETTGLGIVIIIFSISSLSSTRKKLS